jgi:hypothetical protein
MSTDEDIKKGGVSNLVKIIAIFGGIVVICLCGLIAFGAYFAITSEEVTVSEETTVAMVEEATAEPAEVELEPTQDLFLRPTVVTRIVTDTPEPTATPETTNTPEPTATPESAPTITPIPTLGTPWPDDQLRQQIEEVLGDRLVNVSIQPELHNVLVEFAVAEDLMNDTTRDEAKMAIYNSMAVVADSNHDTEVEFKGYLGGSPEDQVIWAIYASSTVHEVDWENFNFSDIYEVASILELHQFLQEEVQ